MPTPRLRGDTSVVVDLIARREEFRTGELRGHYTRWMPSEGRLDPAWVVELGATIVVNRNANKATYVVSSYDTPIAWTDPLFPELVMPTERYSPTTSRHQQLCRDGQYQR